MDIRLCLLYRVYRFLCVTGKEILGSRVALYGLECVQSNR